MRCRPVVCSTPHAIDCGIWAIPPRPATIRPSSCRLVTEPLPPDATGVTDADNYYVPFPRPWCAAADGRDSPAAVPFLRASIS